MIDFKTVTPEAKDELEAYLGTRFVRSCDYSFANILAWEHHEYAVLGDMLILRYLGGEGCYLAPSGKGDLAFALSEIMKDAADRGKKCVIKAMTAEEAALAGEAFKGKLLIKAVRDSFDYVYHTESLAELKGKRYHGKRGHYTRFKNEYPSCTVGRVCSHNVPKIFEMLDVWYAERDPERLSLERAALTRALGCREELGIEGLVLQNGGEVLAFALGSRSSHDTFDVHFEKAVSSVPTAYTAIATEFARYVRANHPEAVYLNREDDMGIEGLRRAKESWCPCRMIEKYTAEEL